MLVVGCQLSPNVRGLGVEKGEQKLFPSQQQQNNKNRPTGNAMALLLPSLLPNPPNRHPKSTFKHDLHRALSDILPLVNLPNRCE